MINIVPLCTNLLSIEERPSIPGNSNIIGLDNVSAWVKEEFELMCGELNTIVRNNSKSGENVDSSSHQCLNQWVLAANRCLDFRSLANKTNGLS